MADAKLSFTFDILPNAAAIARPGDTVLIGFDRTLTDEELEGLREGFAEFTEKTGVHIGFVEHATSMVVARPDADEPVPYELTEKGNTVTLEGCEVEGER